MNKPIDVYFTERAPIARAQWLQKLLQPLAAACKMNAPPPIEIRPTGQWGGWCADPKSAPDGRVCLSSKLIFQSLEKIKYVYLHEATHRLLESKKVKSHGPEFFCLLAILLWRAAEFFELSSWFNLTIYDFQDQPEALAGEDDWRGTVLDWSLETAAELAGSDATAESLADVVCTRWQAFLVQRELDSAATANAAAGSIAQRKNLNEQVTDLKNSQMLWRCLSGLGWLMFMVLTWLNVRGFR